MDMFGYICDMSRYPYISAWSKFPDVKEPGFGEFIALGKMETAEL
jgi:hypothetical protein